MRWLCISFVLTLCACGGSDGGSRDSGSGGAGASGGSSTGGSAGTLGTGGSKSTGGASGTSSGGASTGGASTGGSGGTGTVNVAGDWVAVDAGHKAIFMAAAPNVNKVYMLDKDVKRMFVTTDDGGTWTGLASNTTDGKAFDALVLRMIFDPADTTDNTWWAGGMYGASGVYHTTDGGTTVTSTCFSHNETFSVDLTDPARQTILANPHGGGDLILSTDGGVTCNSILPQLKTADAGIEHAFAPEILDTMTFLVGTGGFGGTNGVFRTTDGGTTWAKVSPQAPPQSMQIAPDGTFVYPVFWNNGLITSKDQGVTWTQGVGYGVLDSGPESFGGTFIGDGRLVWIKAFPMTGLPQLAVSSDYKNFTDFLDPFPAESLTTADLSVGVVYSKPANKLYTFTRYAKISRWDL
jgi:hypothetical protein